MKNVYFLTEKPFKNSAIACPEHRDLLTRSLIPELRNADHVPFDLFLKRSFLKENEFHFDDDTTGLAKIWQDLLPNTMAWNVMSAKMKSLIDVNLSGLEPIVWMNINIRSKNESRVYYVPRFTDLPDVLDHNSTIFVKGTKHIVVPVFSEAKISKYSIFYIPRVGWEVPSGLYVTDSLKHVIRKAGLTGVTFENARVS
jgi:hypothetical protein